MSDTERWLPIVGYEGSYEVSDMGRVRSLDRRSHNGRALRGRMRKLSKNGHSYLTVTLSYGESCTHNVHQLVLDAFVGPPPAGTECCHGDGDRGNNKLGNLRWDTQMSNQGDKLAHGTVVRGARAGRAKLNDIDIERIFDMRRSGCTQQSIADRFKCSETNIRAIISGKIWAHLGYHHLQTLET